jgi:tetratricopeptide (TPR) repeat protein
VNRFLATATLFLLLSPLHAAWHFFSKYSDPLVKEKEMFKESRYKEIITLLGDGRFQYYHGKNLARAYFYLGQSYEYTNHLGQALSFYEIGVRLFPDDLRLLSALALLLHRAGLEEEAQPIFERILISQPKNAEVHLGLAEIDANLGFLKRSAHHYEKTLEAVPENADIWRHYAELLLRLRLYEKAQIAAQKSISLNDDPKTRMDLALIEQAQGQTEQALQEISSPPVRLAYGTQALRLKGLWLLEAQRYSEASLVAGKVMKDAPSDPIAHWIEAQVDLAQGAVHHARKELEQIQDFRRYPFVYKAANALIKSLPQSSLPKFPARLTGPAINE